MSSAVVIGSLHSLGLSLGHSARVEKFSMTSHTAVMLSAASVLHSPPEPLHLQRLHAVHGRLIRLLPTFGADCLVNWRGFGLESLDTNAGSLMHN